MEYYAQALALGAAVAAGLLIGIERGWNLRHVKSGMRVAGVRTFTLLGLLAGLAGLIGTMGQTFAAGAIVAAAAAIVALGYARRTGPNKADATSPVAALVTLGLGTLAGSGNPSLAIAGAALVTLVLALRDEAHGLIERLDEEDLKALARFGVVALAVLPFLPDGKFGPYGAWIPQKLWLVVVLVTGFSFLGYVANRIFGARHGTIATALIGGAYSSTVVTQSLAQRLGREKGQGAEPAGIALASAVMYLRVIVLVAILAPRILKPFVMLVIPALIAAWIAGWLLYRRAEHGNETAAPGNPIAVLPALGFVAFVAIAAVVARWAQGQFGEQGIAILLFLMGSMDVDASIVTAGGLPPEAIGAPLAAIAIGGTIIANMAVKIGVTLAYARANGRSAALALLASTLVLAGSIVVAWMRL